MLGRPASEDNHQMSLSAEARRDHALPLLNLLYAKLVDFPIDCTAFDNAEAAYAGIQNTSREELVSEGILTKRERSLYFFTAKGWSEALFLYGNPSDPSFQQRLGKQGLNQLPLLVCQQLLPVLHGRSSTAKPPQA
jgi:hypothetical protein